MHGSENFLRGAAELFEVLPEQSIQGLSLSIVGSGVLPLATRIQYLGRHARATAWNSYVKDRVALGRHLIEFARNGRIHHGASVFQIHTLSHAERAAYPSGIYQEA